MKLSFSNARAFLPKDKTSIYVGRNLSAWIDNFKVYSEDLSSSDISVASNLKWRNPELVCNDAEGTLCCLS